MLILGQGIGKSWRLTSSSEDDNKNSQLNYFTIFSSISLNVLVFSPEKIYFVVSSTHSLGISRCQTRNSSKFVKTFQI